MLIESWVVFLDLLYEEICQWICILIGVRRDVVKIEKAVTRIVAVLPLWIRFRKFF